MVEINQIHQGDCLNLLKEIQDNSIQCVVTSPPYWGLRDYGHKDQIGLEDTPEEYVNHLVKIFKEIKRVLKEDGTIWLNLGDTYASSGSREDAFKFQSESQGFSEGTPNSQGRGRLNKHPFLKSKDMCGIPFRVAFALQERLGYYLRQAIIWHKPNAMPSSVTDRPSTDYEFIFLLTKTEDYYYEQQIEDTQAKVIEPRMITERRDMYSAKYCSMSKRTMFRNQRAIWSFNTLPYPEAHFAVFPEELPERCIQAGTKDGDTVLDPFAGSGTTLWVAKRMLRKFIGMELSEDYVKLIKKRLSQQLLI